MRLALPERFRSRLEGHLGEHEVAWYADQAAALAAVVDADVLWLNTWRGGEIEALLDAGHTLRWVTTHLAGVDGYPLALLSERGLPLTNGAGLHAVPIAEYALLGMLAAAKGFPELVRARDRREWLREPPGFAELEDTRALILGYGGIGQAIGRRLAGFGVEVTGVRRRDGEAWRERLPEFDWIVLALPATPRSTGIIAAAELARMKPTAWIVNIARGRLIDQAALVEALAGKRIGGAYLDVTDPEPLPADSPLWTLPNVILTPHSSWATRRFDERAAALFLENLDRFAAGRELRNRVDPAAGY
jgi:phosphoglycerate dehydrogenase-like enzyme